MFLLLLFFKAFIFGCLYVWVEICDNFDPFLLSQFSQNFTQYNISSILGIDWEKYDLNYKKIQFDICVIVSQLTTANSIGKLVVSETRWIENGLNKKYLK